MPFWGDFVQSGTGGAPVFRLRGTHLEVAEDSISSEWTSESSCEDVVAATPQEPSGGAQDKKRKRVRKWRIRHRVRGGRSSSSSSYVSSSTSTGSSSDSGGEVARQKRQRGELLREWNAQRASVDGVAKSPGELRDGADAKPETVSPEAPAEPPPSLLAPLISGPPDEAGGEPPKLPGSLHWYGAGKRYRCFAYAPSFLGADDMRAIHEAAQHPSVREINDRKGYLAFKHRVWRFEIQLRALFPALYARLLNLMEQADCEKWRRMKVSKTVYPEVEYILYDVAEMGQPCFIEPHVDNKSAVSLVAMLSAPDEYVGGRSCFRRAMGKNGHRETPLQLGDVVLFRGEKLVHWITPVTSGRRVILQIELSRV